MAEAEGPPSAGGAGIAEQGDKMPPEGPRDYIVRFSPHSAMYDTGNEPAALVRALERLGAVSTIADLSAVRPLAEFDPNETRLAWTVRLQTDASADDVAAVFEFVEDVLRLDIAACPSNADSSDGGQRVSDGAGSLDRGVFVSSRKGDAAASVPTPSVATRADATDAPMVAGEKAVIPQAANGPEARPGQLPPAVTTAADAACADPGAAETESTGAARAGAAANGSGSSSASVLAAPATIRVSLDRVDRLINLIGELVIMEAMLSQGVSRAGLSVDSDVASGLDGIKQLASEIQESVMSIRAQPLKPVFQRMHRIVREASDATGKPARLVTLGEATEVDKTVIERLVDPLTHMIRNAIDHGLEDAEDRRAAGKPAQGTVTLSAAHRSGRVMIEVADDGGGIDRAKVKALAEKRGLIPSGAQLSPAEIDNLLFMPGFSSKSEVSALSGRGVGLDVVRREIQALGGRVAIDSSAGSGTVFTIALPLTLAVLEGMLVSFGNETMVLPISAVVETLRGASATIHPIGHTGRVVANRGELIPVIDLATAFGLERSPAASARGVFIVVECEAGRRAALEVEHIHDQRQVVIKSLEENYGSVPGISAATILGDGRIALIIDPEEIVSSATPDPLATPLAEIV